MKRKFGFFILFCAFSIFGVFSEGINNSVYASVERCGNTSGVVGNSNYTISIRKYCINSQKTLTIYGQIENLENAKNQTLTATVKTTGGKMVSVPVTKENYIGVKEYERITDNYFEQDGTPYKVNIDISSLPYGKLFVSMKGSWNGYAPYGPGVDNDVFGIDYIAQTSIDTTITLDEKRGILNITGTTKNVPAGETVTFGVNEGFMLDNPVKNGSAIVQAGGTFSTTIDVSSMLDQPLSHLSVVSKVKDINGDTIQDFDTVDTPPIYSCSFIENKTVQRTINYLYKDGSIVAKPTVQKAYFKRITNGSCYRGKLVEGTYTVDDNDWEKAHTFEKVNAPKIEEYTYDKEAVNELVVNANSENNVENIIYKKNIIPKDDKIPAQEIDNKGEFKTKISPVWLYAPNTGVEKQNSNALLALNYIILTLITSVAVIRKKL